MIVFWAVVLTCALLFIASWIDLMTGEIPDRITKTLFGGLLLFSAAAAFVNRDPFMFTTPFIVGACFFIVSAILFFLGQWGGGDVKITAGVGVLLGLVSRMGYVWPNMDLTPYYLAYWMNMAFISIPYVAVYTLVLGFMRPNVFKQFLKNIREHRTLFLIGFSFIPSLLSIILAIPNATGLYLMLPVFTVGTVYLKTCEREALMKEIPVSGLSEGDILAQDLVVGGKKLFSKRNIEGLTSEDVERIICLAGRGDISENITIRWGVKFAPILMFALLATIYLGSIFE
ncbi:MAG TPA: prepilin peptidase, partial [Candidatus Altiarchaeales archaeon]|nr:prepilin peptidase [Candidatus Altiarchaeales archaeon]